MILVSMNLHAGHDPGGIPYDVAAACARLDGDFLALQEAWWQAADGADPLEAAAIARGARGLRMELLSGCDLRAMRIAPDDTPGSWGLAVLTALPVLRYEEIHLGRARGDLAPRAAQAVTVRLTDGSALRIANTHLTHRLTSPVQLMRLLLRLGARPDVPTVIAGDLNMPAPVTALASRYSPAVTGRTFPAERPVVQLDHILAGRGVAARCGAVLPSLGSDHLPVQADLRTR